jgi:peptidoglycan/LPS O-acetylase OafA/YrhL/lysophospholipase L1-like esterase
MKRIASLDLLRGIAALAVAIPHYSMLNSDGFYPLGQATAVTAVEVFFVLSGFVLAPQILTEVIPGRTRSLRVFLVRRWMRTIPPYLLALTAVAIITGRFLTPDFVRYGFYVQNLFVQSNVSDFFPVAWSLSVEEWFYVSFAPLLFLLVALTSRRTRAFAAGFAISFILAITLGRLLFEGVPDWDAAIRRVTVFRVDAVAWGFLLYLATSATVDQCKGKAMLWTPLFTFTATGAACILLATWSAQSTVCQLLFPFVASAFGASAVVSFRKADDLITSHHWRQFCIYAGHISYSVYLFHLPLAMLLKPAIGNLPLSLQLAFFCAGLIALATMVWFFFERPILAARPKYHGTSRATVVAANATPRRQSIVAAALLAACGLAVGPLSHRYYDTAHVLVFYSLLIGASLLIFASACLTRVRGLASSALTLLFVTILLPATDHLISLKAITQSATSERQDDVAPAYSFSAAHANPAAFAAWWTRYVAEWIKLGGAKDSTEAPDPKGILPFVPVKNSTGKFFNSEIHINNLGFRGRDIDPDKGNKFRIFALGESPTFGPTLRPGEHPWPEVLGTLIEHRLICDRPIEVINAGTEAYTLVNNLERLQRDILPLKPDMVVSYHGYNGLDGLFDPVAFPRGAPPPKRERVGPSPSLDALWYNLKMAAYRWRPKRPGAHYSEEDILRSKYADAYRQLLEIGRNQGFRVVLATSSMAVAASSPEEVQDFYEAVWHSLDDYITLNQAHNKLVEKLAQQSGVPLIDTTPALDGHWDQDLFLDLVHFTQRGNDAMASTVFDGILPILRRDVNCRFRSDLVDLSTVLTGNSPRKTPDYQTKGALKP